MYYNELIRKRKNFPPPEKIIKKPAFLQVFHFRFNSRAKFFWSSFIRISIHQKWGGRKDKITIP